MTGTHLFGLSSFGDHGWLVPYCTCGWIGTPHQITIPNSPRSLASTRYLRHEWRAHLDYMENHIALDN